MRIKITVGSRRISVVAIGLLSIVFTTFDPALSQTTGGRIIFLAKDEHDVVNLWIADLSNPDTPEQVTPYDEPGTRLYDYQVSADGHWVIYETFFSQSPSNSEIMLLDLETRHIEPISNCAEVNASCVEFSIRPDGHFIAYYQVSRTALLVRVIDLTVSPHLDTVIHEFNPVQDRWHHALPNWTGSSGFLTFNLPGPDYQFQVYDVEQGRTIQILPLGVPQREPNFSPDGTRYAYYESEVDAPARPIAIRNTQNSAEPISRYSEEDLISSGWIGGGIMDWYPDNEHLLIATQWFRTPTEPNMALLQSDLAVFNTTTGSIRALTNDPEYIAFNASLNTDASLVLYQRRHRTTEADCYCAQIMLYHLNSGEITELGILGSVPHWLTH